MFSAVEQLFKEKKVKILAEPNFDEILDVLMQNLASVDSDTREGSLDILWEILESGELPDERMIFIGSKLAVNLSEGIGEKGSDSVFLRTFSVLLIGVIVVQDELRKESGNSFLDESIFTDWFEKSKAYVLAEKDFRSFIPGKGWAHAISHGADVLRDFAVHRFTTAKDHAAILEILADKLFDNREEIYINNDDNRMARVVVTIMLRNQLKLPDYEKWLDGLLKRFGEKSLLDYAGNREEVIPWFNTITFLRALYLVLLYDMKVIHETDMFEQKPQLRDEVMQILLDVLKKMDSGLNYRA